MIKVHHACITVSDIDQALAFYRDTLGLKMTMDFEISGEEFDRLHEYPNTRARLLYFEEGLELAYYYSPSDGRPLNARLWDHGHTFLILEVSDLEKTYATLVDRGVKFFAAPQLPKKEAPVGKIPVAHLRGPDGVRISLIEWPQSR
jgi:catechol 2,3-dioxygenase-like lactoylglutathione lyase family enzyme